MGFIQSIKGLSKSIKGLIQMMLGLILLKLAFILLKWGFIRLKLAFIRLMLGLIQSMKRFIRLMKAFSGSADICPARSRSEQSGNWKVNRIKRRSLGQTTGVFYLFQMFRTVYRRRLRGRCRRLRVALTIRLRLPTRLNPAAGPCGCHGRRDPFGRRRNYPRHLRVNQ